MLLSNSEESRKLKTIYTMSSSKQAICSFLLVKYQKGLFWWTGGGGGGPWFQASVRVVTKVIDIIWLLAVVTLLTLDLHSLTGLKTVQESRALMNQVASLTLRILRQFQRMEEHVSDAPDCLQDTVTDTHIILCSPLRRWLCVWRQPGECCLYALVRWRHDRKQLKKPKAAAASSTSRQTHTRMCVCVCVLKTFHTYRVYFLSLLSAACVLCVLCLVGGRFKS